MYTGPSLAGTSIAMLPNTSGDSLFMHAAIAAIVVGVTATLLQLGVAAYRLSVHRSK